MNLNLRGVPLQNLDPGRLSMERRAVIVRALPLLGGRGNGLGTHGTSTNLTSSSILAAPRASGMFWSAISTATTSSRLPLICIGEDDAAACFFPRVSIFANA